MVREYALCGWRVRSDIALPELAAWAGDDRAADLVYMLGKVPPAPDRGRHESSVIRVDERGGVRIGIENVCDYLVENGNCVTIDPKLPCTARDIRVFLLSSAHGVICHQRAVLPIRGAAVEIDGRTVVLAGAAGAGKSTLASAFLARGHRVLADDVAALAMTGPEAVILPGHRVVRLWRDAAVRAGWSLDTLETCRDGLDKFGRQLDAMHVGDPLKPIALIHLLGGPSNTITFQQVRGAAALQALRHNIYRWRTLVGLIGEGRALSRIAAAAPLLPCHLLLRRPQRFECLDATVDAILRRVRQAASA